MLISIPNHIKNVSIHTGNLLNLNELKIRAGQTPKDELLESLTLILSKSTATDNSTENSINIDGGNPLDGVDDNEERKDLKTSLKIFIPSTKGDSAMHEAIQTALTALGNQTIDSLVISFSDGSNSFLPNLKALWKVTEEYVEKGKILRIGLSDIDTDDFISFYNSAKIKPSIVQINLSACCVVPPQLQEFTKQHDIQLLTHNDPSDILSDNSLSQLFSTETTKRNITLNWAVRYQIHVKCRGVLCSKGYLISTQKL